MVDNVLMIRLHLTSARALLTQNVRVTSMGVAVRAGLTNREHEVNCAAGLHYVPWNWRGRLLRDGLRAVPGIVRLIRETNPAVIHVNAISDLLPVSIAIRVAHPLGRRPVVVAMARSAPTWASPRRAWLAARLVTYLADGFVALARSHERQMLELGVPPSMLVCIPNPYDETLVNWAGKKNREAASMSSRSTRISYVAALRQGKAQDILIKAVALVRETHPGVHCDLIGSTWHGEEAYAEQLHALVEQLRLHDHVHLRGELPHAEVVTSLATTDIVVFPTLAEMMPRTVIEAMVLGKPVIASGVDGILDLIEDGETGVLVPPGDAAALARAICRLIENPKLASELGVAGQAHVREFCSPARVGRLFCEFYAQLMEPRCSVTA